MALQVLLLHCSTVVAQENQVAVSATSADIPKPLSPEQSMGTMKYSERLQVELVAAEPMVQDPVAFCWDATGAMYVAEMGDYPAEKLGGRIRKLEDTNRDGKMDRATVFVDQVPYPTSVLPYRDGILVAAAPDILWFADGDHDGIAEHRKVLITGFGEGNQQLRVNGLIWGLDGWVYGANGRSDGEIAFVESTTASPGTRLSIRNRDFRFHLEERRIETTGGFTQFGQSFDDFGNRFISWNTIPIRHVVMEQRYLARNPRAPITATSAELSVEGSTPRVFPISQTTKRFNAEPPGYFNASCGLSIFRGDRLPIDYHGNAFACEPLSNLVHRDILEPHGVSFIAHRSSDEQDREFLSASDPWFRPVNAATGPDGALYIADFYRPWVEHPQWVADEKARNSVDFSVGKEYGRIYRVVERVESSKDRKSLSSGDLKLQVPIDLHGMDDDQLVDLLGWPNAWQRETAQRLLVERATVNLEHVWLHARNGETEFERLHAYAVLFGLRDKREESSAWLSSMLLDRSTSIRRIGLQWMGEFLGGPSEEVEVWWERAVSLIEDADAAVRFQAICSMGDFSLSPIASDKLAAVLVKAYRENGSDPWMRQAIFSGLHGRVPEFLGEFAKQMVAESKDSSNDKEFDHAQLQWLLLVVGAIEPHQVSTMESLYDSLAINSSSSVSTSLQSILSLGMARQLGASWVTDFARRNSHFDSQVKRITERSKVEHPIQDRLLALGMMEYVSGQDIDVMSEIDAALAESLELEQPLTVQQWAVRSAAGTSGPNRTTLLIEALSKTSPAIRRTIVDSMIGRQELASQLALAIRDGRVVWTEMDNLQRQLLLAQLPEPERRGLEETMQAKSSGDRHELVSKYVQAYADNLDRELGRQLFVKHCQSCHAIGADGYRVGPDLTAVAGRSPADIIVDVLEPNRSVSADGYGYSVLTKDDEVLSGLIAGETATSVTLKKPGGELVSILREEIQELRHLGKSLMPEGFERSLTPEELACLVSYLKSVQ